MSTLKYKNMLEETWFEDGSTSIEGAPQTARMVAQRSHPKKNLCLLGALLFFWFGRNEGSLCGSFGDFNVHQSLLRGSPTFGLQLPAAVLDARRASGGWPHES